MAVLLDRLARPRLERPSKGSRAAETEQKADFLLRQLLRFKVFPGKSQPEFVDQYLEAGVFCLQVSLERTGADTEVSGSLAQGRNV